jgi:CheY-like chemotaxis protein
LAGNCVAFVGAGFSAAAPLPSWNALLREVADKGRLSGSDRKDFDELVAGGSSHDLDQAAQLLEDRLKRPGFVRILVDRLGHPDRTVEMARRLWYLKRIPFRSILTTNFDGLLEGPVSSRETHLSVLQPSQHRWWEQAFWNEPKGARVVKLHGDLSDPSNAPNIVLTREDYRRRLYANSDYVTFLRSLLSTTTVVYFGFSFTDAYLNELRSEVIAMLGNSAERTLAYAIASDVPRATRQHFRDHEGIHVLSYPSNAGKDFTDFDRYLEALYRETNPLPRFERILSNRRLLWLDAHVENNEPGIAFLQRAGATHESITIAKTLTEAVRDLERAQVGGVPFDLVITHWGMDRTPDPVGVSLLKEIRCRDLRTPVIVFSSSTDVRERRRLALQLGALGYHHQFEELFQDIARVLDDEPWPA